jgi:hypothetical protein
VPKPASRDHNDAPRRRRGAAAVIEQQDERGLAMRLLLHSPKDLVAGMFASAAVLAIIINAIFMQTGRHPSPMFGSAVAVPASISLLPRPRPLEASARLGEPRVIELRAAAVDAKPADSRASEQLLSPVKIAVTPAAPAAQAAAPARPPAPIPTATRNDPVGDLIISSRRVAAVQRALTEYGYGQLKPTGTAGSDTQAAIQKFERDRKLPVTGQVSDRLTRELTLVTGRPID